MAAKAQDEPSPRKRRPRNSLSQEAILDAAESLAPAGFGAVSMRAVANEVGAVPMALYNHFPTKDALVDALLNRVLGRFEAPPVTDDPWADLRAFARAHRKVLEDHPWAVAPLFVQPSPGISSVRIGELALHILERAGLSKGDSVAAFSGVLALNYGWMSFTTAREHDPDSRGGEVEAALRMLPADVFPLTVATASEWGAYGSDDHYFFVLDGFLAGVRASHGAPPRG